MYVFPLSKSYKLKDCTVLLYADDVNNFALEMMDQA